MKKFRISKIRLSRMERSKKRFEASPYRRKKRRAMMRRRVRPKSNDETIGQIESLIGNTGGNNKPNESK